MRKARVAELIPPDIVGQVPLDLLGLITGLPAEIEQIPWDGPQIRLIEHQSRAPGHAALLIERGVLVAGAMLSDVLIPLLDLNDTTDPIEDYLSARRLLEGVADDIDVVIPGHGSIGEDDQIHARIERPGRTCMPCVTRTLSATLGSGHRPPTTGCLVCTNGKYGTRPREPRTLRPHPHLARERPQAQPVR